MTFSNLGLSPSLLATISDKGYTSPTPVQAKAIPTILKGRDVVAVAQTGTGKTAAFVLPIIQRLEEQRLNAQSNRGKRISALILVPTRELAKQVQSSVVAYAKKTSLTSMAMYGGTDIDEQKSQLIEGIDVLVATPGRLIDMLNQRAVYLDSVQTVVLDEADRMLDMGFSDDIYRIIDRLPQRRQSLLFTATMSKYVQSLSDELSHYDVNGAVHEVRIEPKTKTAKNIEQWLITVDKDTKSALLSHLIIASQWSQALIFVEKKHAAAKLVAQLAKRGIDADSIHGDRSQAQREQVLERFKRGQLKYLVATGVAARGIDIGQLERVVNYDLPFKAEDYIHRIGRTGRAGQSGEAISFVTLADFKNLIKLEGRLNHLIERRVIEGFEPRKPVPETVLNYVPKQKR